MSDYSSHPETYAEYGSTAAMQLAHLYTSYPPAPADEYAGWKQTVPSQRTELSYGSEFAAPHQSLEQAPDYYAYNSYVPLDAPPSAGSSFAEPVSSSGSFPPEPSFSSMYPVPAVPSSAPPAQQYWSGAHLHPSPVAEAPSFRFTPYTVKSQRRISSDVGGSDTPSSPLSLARSKRSSSSPSPGPLTPAIGQITLHNNEYVHDSRPSSQGSSRNPYHRSEDQDPDRPYPCSSCRMAFARQHDLTRHSRVHTGETPYQCRGCGQGFRRSDARSRHWNKERPCFDRHQRLVEGTEEGRKLQKSLSRHGDRAAGRHGTTTFRVHPPNRSTRGSN